MAGEAFSESKFEELDICNELKKGLDRIGFEQMTPIQAEAIPVLLTGCDVIGQAQTGTGKTAAFGLPLLNMIDPANKKLQAIVLCPTRELAMQVAGELRNFAVCMQNVKLLPVYGGQDIRNQIQGLKGTQIIVGTPGRVMDHMRRHTIKMDEVKLCVLDEADEMLKMGFIEDMEVILGAIDHPHQTCLFSATMPREILDLTEKFQQNPKFIKVTPKELTIDRIEQYYYAVKREYKEQALIRLMTYHQYKKSMVFCNTKAMADQLAAQLKLDGYPAEALHGDLSQRQRDNVMNSFRNGTVSILIATDIAARGIDVDDVEAVFNYDIPQETEYYVHRIGRTGRAGRTGVSHTLCQSREFGRIREIEGICHSKMEEKMIPSSGMINDAKIHKVLEKVMALVDSEANAHYRNVIEGFCKKREIDVYDFAAALVKNELGDMVEELDINLPGNDGKKRRRKSNEEHEYTNRRPGKRSESGKKVKSDDVRRDGSSKRTYGNKKDASESSRVQRKKNKENSRRELHRIADEMLGKK